MQTMDKKKITIKCPQCEEQFDYYSSEFRPFCSKPCQTRDLGAWLIGEYAIAGKPVPTHEERDDDDEELLN